MRRPSHAYLLVGPRGSAKHQAARWFAAGVLGLGEDDENITHPNLLVVQRPEGKKNISIDQIKELTRRLAVSSYDHTRPKAVVIDHIENLSREASNALLKALEEPPSSTVFILTTAQVGALLPTIISRTQLIRFLLPPVAQLEQALSAHYDPDQVKEALALSEGLPARAMRMLGNSELLEQNKQLAAEAHLFATGSITQRFMLAKAMHEAEQTAAFLEALICTYRTKFSILETSKSLHRIMKAQEYIQHNLNSRLVLEQLALQIGGDFK